MIDLDQELQNAFSLSSISENQFTATLVLPKTFSFFTGHFPQNPVLPAVALVDISILITKKKFPNLNAAFVKKIEHLKIKAPLGPDEKIQIQVLQKSELQFAATWKTLDAKEIAEINFLFAY